MATLAGHARTAPVAWTRAALLLSVPVLAVLGYHSGMFIASMIADPTPILGDDLRIYLDRTRDWMATGHLYVPYQLAGPYDTNALPSPAFYPPTLLYLTVPFALGAPAVLWWAIPLGIAVASLAAAQPTRVGWLAIALTLYLPRTWTILFYGNPAMWALAAVIAGVVWTWPFAFTPLKPVLGLFALAGIRRRPFWIGAAIALAVCVPFGLLWRDYAMALVNARNDRGLEYLLGELPVAALLAFGTWTGVRRSGPGARSTGGRPRTATAGG